VKRRRGSETVTGGKEATQRHIPGDAVLSVCMPVTLPAPRNWRWYALSDLARMESGHTPSRKHPEYWGGDVPWIAVGDAGRNHGRVIQETAECTNELGISNSSARLLPKGTVCLSRGGTVGYVTVLGRPMATSQGFANWICGAQLDPFFLKYLFLREADALDRFAMGATIQTIYYPDIKAFHVCIPSLPEQRRIVALLDAAFEGIATAAATAERNRQNARDLFESHLAEVFSRRGEGWVETTLGDEVDLLSGFAFKSSGYTSSPHSVRLLRGDNIVQGSLRWEDEKRWPEDDVANHVRFSLCEGDVVLAMDRPWVKAGLKRAQIGEGDLPCLLVQRTARLRAGGRLNSRFLYFLVSSASFVRHIVGVQTGSGVPHISGQQIKDFGFARPPLAAQRELASRLDSLSSETHRLSQIYEQKQTALADLKRSLLHQAFNGEL
jgi:type I restriction enzyme S subunit